MILEDYLEQNARLYPDKEAIVCGDERCTWVELNERVEHRQQELLADSYSKGQVVCVRALPEIDYLVTYFAFHRAGCVVAPMEREMPEDTFRKVAGELEGQQVPDGSADILYTTGTTGRSKGVIISHSTIIADAENLIDGQGFRHETVFVINGPMNHIGSLSKVYPIVLLGATMILVDGLKDLNRFFAAFDYPSNLMATFLVPASIRILIQLGEAKLAALAKKIDFIETGAAAISQTDMLALCRILPNSRLYNTYASTETGIISTYNYNDGRCVMGCLGRPMRHSEIIITDKGLIACKGKTLMTGYVGDPERTAQILIGDTIYTSDIGRLDEEGMLHLSGRKDDVINVGGFKVAPTEVEDAALSLPAIKDCICISVEHKITGRALKLLVVMREGEPFDKKGIARHLSTKLESFKVPMLYEQIDAVKRTFNGKIDRKYYSQQ